MPTSSPATPPTGCGVVRQVRYSLHNENSIDLVLFLNGLPVATVELKTDFTQSIGDAIDQYRFDRLPRPKGQAAEPLLSFPNGALVHFAVSNSEVHMVTKLDGPATAFLPFNQGDDGAAGNPVNPKAATARRISGSRSGRAKAGWKSSAATSSPSATRRSRSRRSSSPAFHQLDVTRKLQAAVLHDGPGGKYLVQHSAGSGKTNSIAWTAHFLAELHDAQHKKVFDTVLVVSDRNVIDSQLQEALFDFQRTTGVVATIKGNDGSKSGELAEALSGDKKIVVCTIQTFPFALEAVRKLAATQGKRFAVIADEAHSSQTGEAAAKLKAVLSPRGTEGTERRRRSQHGRHPGGADGGAGRRWRHHLRGVHGDAEEQDDGALRHAPRSHRGSPANDNVPGPVPRLFHAAGHRGEVHPRRAAELHALQAWPSSWRTTARTTTRRRSSAARR